jgi:CubicO group peptidase (beta-lactamase class C family)
MKRLILFFTLLILIENLTGQTRDLNPFFSSDVKEHNFSGTILIQKNGETQYHKSFGLSDKQFNIPNTNYTKYKIASITKIFTSVLIMQLHEQGKIDLNSPLKAYLPDYKGEGGDRIKISNLLNHTSGLPYVGPTSKEDALNNGMEELQMPHSVDDIINKYHSRKLVNEPGTVFNYNNGDYIILGKIIEKISGKSFEEVLDQQILKTAGMSNSGLLFQYKIVENLAYSYFTMNDTSGLVNDLPVYIQNWYSAGAMYSSSSDLIKFSDALFSGKLVKPETLNLIIKPGLDEYGFGVWVYEKDISGKKYKVIKRPGDIMGTRTMFVHMPGENLSIIILANTDSTDLDEFTDRIIQKMLQ